jgi:hypothetical protein
LARSDLFDDILNQFKTTAGAQDAAVGRGAAALSMPTEAPEKP